MTFIYEIIKHDNFLYESIKRTNDDGEVSFIPKDPANSDYQEYLKWVEENNE